MNRKLKIFYIVVTMMFIALQIIGGYFLKQGIKEAYSTLFFVYVLFNVLVGSIFIAGIKVLVHQIFDEVNCILERAIDGEEISTLNDETVVALTITKVSKLTRNNKRQLEEAVERKAEYEKLISDISHQTKTPISNILLFSELLVAAVQGRDDNLLNYADNIVSQTEKLKWLINSLIYMSRLENGMIKYNIEEHSFEQLLLRVMANIYADAEKKQMDIITPNCLGYQVKIDLKWTAEAFQNIIINSIKYSPEGSQIEISVERYQYYVVVSIKDYGIGIPKQEISCVYQRFYRGENVKNEQGIGIGLYLTREILRKQGGYIVISNNEKVGTKSRVYLPIA